MFEAEALKLKAALPHHLKAIHHIGSTSIPEMPAKPIIDIMFEIESIDTIHEIEWLLSQQGYDPLLPKNTGSTISRWSPEKIIKAMEANQNLAATH